VTSTGKAAEAEVAYIDAGKTLRQAGHLMRELGVGALRVRGENGKIQGTISHDMVIRRIAAGGDPKTVTVGEVAAFPPYIPGRLGDSGARHGDQGQDPGDDQIHWEGAGPDRRWHWAAPDAPDRAVPGGGAKRKLPGLVALPVTAAGVVIRGRWLPPRAPLAWAA
jgi:CBS domain-containing protein